MNQHYWLMSLLLCYELTTNNFLNQPQPTLLPFLCSRRSGGFWMPVVVVLEAAAPVWLRCPAGGAGADDGGAFTDCSRVGLFLIESSWGLVRPANKQTAIRSCSKVAAVMEGKKKKIHIKSVKWKTYCPLKSCLWRTPQCKHFPCICNRFVCSVKHFWSICE